MSNDYQTQITDPAEEIADMIRVTPTMETLLFKYGVKDVPEAERLIQQAAFNIICNLLEEKV
jgi:hypothetical protein